jgi:hypothetical protein
MNLAACKTNVDETIAPDFDSFKTERVKQHRNWIDVIKLHALPTTKRPG